MGVIDEKKVNAATEGLGRQEQEALQRFQSGSAGQPLPAPRPAPAEAPPITGPVVMPAVPFEAALPKSKGLAGPERAEADRPAGAWPGSLAILFIHVS